MAVVAGRSVRSLDVIGMRLRSFLGGAVCAILVVGALLATYIHFFGGNHATSRAQFTVGYLSEQIELYRTEKGRYPTTEEGLAEIVKAGVVRGLPDTDPWGRKYHYRYPSEQPGVPFELWSYGEDGKVGGYGANRDFTNWDK